jgi:hypothetical protein
VAPLRCLRGGATKIRTPGKDGVLDGDQRSHGTVSGDTDRSSDVDEPIRDPALRRRERRRLAVAITSTVLAIPLLIVEIAPGVDASPEATPAAHIGEVLAEGPNPEPPEVAAPVEALPAKAFGMVSGDELAAARPLAIFSGGDALRAAAVAEEEEAERARVVEEERLRRREEEAAAREAARRAEEARQAEIRAAEAADVEASDPAPAGGPTPEQWHALRMCESTNNYQAISGNRLYYGAYQFYQGTWDNTALLAGRDDLVGVRPDHASVADQDAMAQALYQRRGAGPWPHCGVHLR